MIDRTHLLQYLTNLLEPERFKDYAPNGLQVQGADEIQVLVSGVTASQALIDQAIALKANAVLVHHGYFWRGEDPTITGMKYHRVKSLMDHNINLIAYHLPLDAHPDLGNNAQLAKRLGLTVEGGLDPQDQRPIGNVGSLDSALELNQFTALIDTALQRKPLLVAAGSHAVRRVAWCTGGAQNYIEKAVAMGVDAYISGEISEQTTHIARESGIHYFAVGHHASERYGAMALGQHLADRFQLQHQFVDIDNPA